MKITGPDNKIYELPDGTTYDQLQEFFGANKSSVDPSNNNDQNNASDASRMMKETGGNRTPIDTLKDLATGLGNAGQNIGDLMIDRFRKNTFGPMAEGARQAGKEVPPFITNQLNAKNPQLNIQEQFGTQNGNPLAQILGQYAPGVLAGGPSMINQILSNAAFGATQGRPGEENLFGYLPEGRYGAALEGGLTAAIPFGIGKVFKALKKGVNMFRPGALAKEEIFKLAHGITPSEYQRAMYPNATILNPPNSLKNITENLPTSGQNIEELGKRTSFARKSAEAEALAPKKQLMETESKQRVFPSQKRGEELISDVSKIFGENARDISHTEKTELTKALKTYYKDGDMEQLINKSEDIFNHPGLTEKQVSNLSESLEMQPLKNGKYLSRPNVDLNYKGLGLDKAHGNYKKTPTVENGDKLLSNIGEEIRKLESMKKRAGGLTGAPRIKLDRLIANRSALSSDLESYFKTLPPEKQTLYADFRKKWRENIPKYDKSGKGAGSNTIKALSKSESQGLTREQVGTAFKGPNKNVNAIVKEMGPSGNANILYNNLVNLEPGDAKALAKTLMDLKQSGGYEAYITPEHEKLAQQLLKRTRNKTIAKILGSILGVGSVGGAGYLGYRAR